MVVVSNGWGHLSPGQTFGPPCQKLTRMHRCVQPLSFLKFFSSGLFKAQRYNEIQLPAFMVKLLLENPPFPPNSCLHNDCG